MLSCFFGVYIARTRAPQIRRTQASQIELAEPFEYNNIAHASSTLRCRIRTRKKAEQGDPARREPTYRSPAAGIFDLGLSF